MVKIRVNDGQWLVTIPKDIAEQVNLEKGESVTFTLDQFNNMMILRKKK